MSKVITRNPTQLRLLADNWQRRADEEKGKTTENGWNSWELYQASLRSLYCEQKRDACLTEAIRMEQNPS